MKYQILYCDCPWRYNARNNPNTKFGLGASQYPTLSVGELVALAPLIKAITAPNCALFMWAVPPKLPWALEVMQAWGFRYCTKAFTWIKVDRQGVPRLLPGYYTGSNSEDCWLGMRGSLSVVNKGVRQVVSSTLRGHSQKPDLVRERIVDLFGDLPRLELFAREKIEGWQAVGNEIDGLHITEALERLIRYGNTETPDAA